MLPIISFFILSISLCFWSYDLFSFLKHFLPICILIEVFNSFTLSNYYFPGDSDDEESAWNADCFSWWLCLNFINSLFPSFPETQPLCIYIFKFTISSTCSSPLFNFSIFHISYFILRITFWFFFIIDISLMIFSFCPYITLLPCSYLHLALWDILWKIF